MVAFCIFARTVVSAYYHEAETWCRKIGATRAAQYLQAGARHFPGGRVPVDDGQRRAIGDELGDRDDGPIYAVDQEYDGAADEIPEHLRNYIRAHVNEYAAAELPVKRRRR